MNNLQPFIIAPPTSVSIFFAVSLQQKDMGFKEGNTALMISSALLCLVGLVPAFGRLLSRVRPPRYRCLPAFP